MSEGLVILSRAKLLVGHNIIGFDLKAIKSQGTDVHTLNAHLVGGVSREAIKVFF